MNLFVYLVMYREEGTDQMTNAGGGGVNSRLTFAELIDLNEPEIESQ